jgi:hypothetical protein
MPKDKHRQNVLKTNHQSRRTKANDDCLRKEQLQSQDASQPQLELPEDF